MDKTLAKKVLALEKDVKMLEKNQNRIIDETKKEFSQLTKIVKNLSSTLLKSMETDRVVDDLVIENGERLSEIEDNFENFKEEITNKLAWGTDTNNEDKMKVLESIVESIYKIGSFGIIS
jgi:guanylate kinase